MFKFSGPVLDHLNEQLAQLNEDRSRRLAERKDFKHAIEASEMCLQKSRNLRGSTGTIDSFWDAIQAGMTSTTSAWPLLETLELADLEIDLYKETWSTLRSAVGGIFDS